MKQTTLSAENNYGFSDAWTPSEEEPGYMVKTVVYRNVTINLYAPILEPEERERRARKCLDAIAPIAAPYI